MDSVVDAPASPGSLYLGHMLPAEGDSGSDTWVAHASPHRFEPVENWASETGGPAAGPRHTAERKVVLLARPGSRSAGLRTKAALGERHGSSKDAVPVTLTPEIMRRHYDRPLHCAAHALGVCATTLKKACRRLGIERWPYRHLRYIDNELVRLQPLACVNRNAQARAQELEEDRAGIFSTYP